MSRGGLRVELHDERGAKAEIAHLEANRALDFQERTIEALRTRAALILSSGFVLAGFAVQASSERDWPWLGGLVALAAATVLALIAGGPVDMVTVRATTAVAFVNDDGLTATDMRCKLAEASQKHRDEIEDAIEDRYRRLTWSVAALGAEAGLFMLAARM